METALSKAGNARRPSPSGGSRRGRRPLPRPALRHRPSPERPRRARAVHRSSHLPCRLGRGSPPGGSASRVPTREAEAGARASAPPTPPRAWGKRLREGDGFDAGNYRKRRLFLENGCTSGPPRPAASGAQVCLLQGPRQWWPWRPRASTCTEATGNARLRGLAEWL